MPFVKCGQLCANDKIGCIKGGKRKIIVTDLRPQQAPRDQGVWSPPAAVTLESPLEDEVRARVRAQTEAVRSKAEAEAARKEAEAARQETARVRAQALAEAQARKAACSGCALS